VPRWSAYGQLDTRLLEDGDARFIGVDMTRDRALLGPGMLARAENKRLRDGSAVTRAGNIAAPDFNPAFVKTFIGSGIYSNPNADEVMLIAEVDATYVWALQNGKDAVKVNLVAGQAMTATSSVEFVQAFDKVLLLRNPPSGRPMLVWDGITGHTFDPMPTPPSAHTTPATTHGEPFQNRVLYYYARYPTVPWRDQFVQSDVLVYNSYDDVLGVFRINAGESDWISRIWPYFQESVVVFKRRSIHQAMNFTVDPTQLMQRQLSKRLGLCGTRCVVEAGRDLLFLNEPGGIYRLNEVIQDQVATEPLPVSDAIMPIIRRINWRAAEVWACAQSRMEYAYFALPLDDTVNGNNVVVVYNTATNQWESTPDTWLDPTFRIHAMHVTQYAGGRALFGLDYVNRKVYVLYQGPTDEINNDIFPVNDLMETRGYVMGDPAGFKRFQRSVMALRTLEPVITVSAITDGVNEVKTCNPVPLTKDRLKFYPHGHADFDPLTGDPNESKREDYSTGENLDNFVGEDFEFLPVGPISFVPPSGLPGVGPKQESLEPFSVRQNGRWVSMRIENLGFACDVLSVGVEAIPLERTRTAA
jgi:hypothetical protein